MNTAHSFSKAELIEILEKCINKTLGSVDKNRIFERTKQNQKITGIAGDVIEQSVLGLPSDNKQRPDLNVDGVLTELKSTGIRISKKNSSRYEAKEPMSITAVSPNDIVNEEFNSSNFWHKLEHMLLVYYLYSSPTTVPAAAYADFPIKGYQFHMFSEDDKLALEADWELVRDFIIELQKAFEDYKKEYPRISSELRDRLFMIDTAPKWPNPPRFRLKRSVVTGIIQSHFGNCLEQLPGRYISYKDIDNKCRDLTFNYRGYTVSELINHFGIVNKTINKAICEQVVVRMFDGHAKKMQKIELFQKIGMIGKTVTLTQNALSTEDMKFVPIDFNELNDPNIDFEDSLFREVFNNVHILCIIFEEPNRKAALRKNVFIGFKRIVFSDEFIDNHVKPIWEKSRRLIFDGTLIDEVETDNHGNPIINKNGTVRSAPNFPKSKEGIVFIRGSGSDSLNKPEVVNDIKMYKQYLWIKGTYIAERISQTEFL